MKESSLSVVGMFALLLLFISAVIGWGFIFHLGSILGIAF